MQNTAYYLRISDWSSDFCSSDLVAVLHRAPQRSLVLPGPERRAHNIGRRGREIRVAIDAVVDQQMAGQRLAEDALALVAGTDDCFHRLDAGVVHDIERHVEHLGDADGAVGGLAPDGRRAREGMAPGPRTDERRGGK